MKSHERSASALNRWLELTDLSRWTSLIDVRKTFRSADEIRLADGRTVVVFNVSGNQFRLIAAVHYNRGVVYVLRFLTHAEYDTDRWKDDLSGA